ncbi:hypothetical protein BDW62DRAFT_179615 [Aspergillus aurantiobrunneus]
MNSKVGYDGFPANPRQAHNYSQQPSYSQPQQPPPAQSYPCGLEVAFTSWSGRHLRVTENTREGPLVYAADLKSHRPHMRFQAQGTANLPATVTFHSFSRRVDITINGHELPMHSERMLKHAYGFDSRALGGKHLVWKRSMSWVSIKLHCVDSSGTEYATFSSHRSLSGKRAGRLEILQPAAAGGKAATDELVVTGLANLSMVLRQNSAAAAGAGGAAAGGGGGGGC